MSRDSEDARNIARAPIIPLRCTPEPACHGELWPSARRSRRWTSPAGIQPAHTASSPSIAGREGLPPNGKLQVHDLDAALRLLGISLCGKRQFFHYACILSRRNSVKIMRRTAICMLCVQRSETSLHWDGGTREAGRQVAVPEGSGTVEALRAARANPGASGLRIGYASNLSRSFGSLGEVQAHPGQCEGGSQSQGGGCSIAGEAGDHRGCTSRARDRRRHHSGQARVIYPRSLTSHGHEGAGHARTPFLVNKDIQPVRETHAGRIDISQEDVSFGHRELGSIQERERGNSRTSASPNPRTFAILGQVGANGHSLAWMRPCWPRLSSSPPHPINARQACEDGAGTSHPQGRRGTAANPL